MAAYYSKRQEPDDEETRAVVAVQTVHEDVTTFVQALLHGNQGLQQQLPHVIHVDLGTPLLGLREVDPKRVLGAAEGAWCKNTTLATRILCSATYSF